MTEEASYFPSTVPSAIATPSTSTTTTPSTNTTPSTTPSVTPQTNAPSLPIYQPRPIAPLEHALLSLALGPLTNLTILDLTADAGYHAHQALLLGASHVDLVTRVPPPLTPPPPTTTTAGSKAGALQIHTGSATALPPLPRQTYDVVLANWIFDTSPAPAVQAAIWTGILSHLRPDGGRVVGLRVSNPFSGAFKHGKYGVRYKNLREVEGGVRYTVVHQAGEKGEEGRFEAGSVEAFYTGRRGGRGVYGGGVLGGGGGGRGGVGGGGVEGGGGLWVGECGGGGGGGVLEGVEGGGGVCCC
ncbi:hypothetical protein C8A05DRAFT_12441 [Staphylotrichum tortipilum]|uniref:Methyltransferase domain-containing protein n=1 Tax=Staphylotrichum tortipilum TaxID=2831512 RepID=A0AAN6MTP0_9PEZI|nr:hypothetical protein C8A05DRAFT_12441 [Staphylotrichum longicolle]